MEDHYDAVIIGAGISGIATAKTFIHEYKFRTLVIEKYDTVGGLWQFRKKEYGCMSFTHINVSKENYSFSDFPFPEGTPDFPHHKQMAAYINSYVDHFELRPHIAFNTTVAKLARNADSSWAVDVDDGHKRTIRAKFVAVASGHHAAPSHPMFPGLDGSPNPRFKGVAEHAVHYNDAEYNGVKGKDMVIVGIGNSAVDVAVEAVGKAKSVTISTRSGAWVVPNYLFGTPTDHYACRLFLSLPWWVATRVLEGVIVVLTGSPSKWGLFPKMRALQSQPTVSGTLVFHIQRGNIKVKPNIKSVEENCVVFEDGTKQPCDYLSLCTGYKISIPFLEEETRAQVMDEDAHTPKLYKNVFSPNIGHSLAFIGFVQPASGGILTMAETQARWFAELCKDNIRLPDKSTMDADILKENREVAARYTGSKRHTIQRDPIVYNDEITSEFGARPSMWRHPTLAWRLLLGSCGAAQWRLQGPFKSAKARDMVSAVPVTGLLHYSMLLVLLLLAGGFAAAYRGMVSDAQQTPQTCPEPLSI